MIAQAEKQPVIVMQACREGARAAFKGLEMLNCATLIGAHLIDALLSRGEENSSK